jgi:hypothetical protein
MTPKNLERWKELKKEISNIEEEEIHPKIDVVVRIILKAFGKNDNHYNWYFQSADAGEVGFMEIADGHISVVIDTPYNLSTSVCDYCIGFPVNFLFMNVENIISYIKTERNRDVVDARNKEKIRKRAHQKLYNTFSEEEIKALGFKL